MRCRQGFVEVSFKFDGVGGVASGEQNNGARPCSLESLRRPERRLEPAGGVDEAALVALDLCVEDPQVLP